MKIYTIQTDIGPQLAIEEGEDLRPISHDELSAINAPPQLTSIANGSQFLERKDRARILAPLLPGKIIAIGLNYLDHIAEAEMETPSQPLVMAKFPSSIIGPTDAIEFDPQLTGRVDWEAELAVVIGRRARRIKEADALDYVFGYTVSNDVSARDLQWRDGQWVRSKSLDTFCPIGPCIVTASEILDPQELAISARVNGETVQQSSTDQMLFGVAELIEHLSNSFTLEPGDLVMTGTPWGVGEFMEPQRSLQPGDVLETEVERIGRLVNPVRHLMRASR